MKTSNRPSITGVALAVLFLFPLVFDAFDSVHGRAGSAQASGFGFGYYTAMAKYGEGIGTYIFNTAVVAIVGMREQAFGVTDYGALEAGVVVMALPCVALFLVLQRHCVQGFTTGALRG